MTTNSVAPAPTAIMRTFTRACGHEQAMIWTVGDEAQAARYQATGCSVCRTPAITFAPGWGRRTR